MISGHRRLYAAKKAGLKMIPAIVKEMSDDDAIIYMVDSNLQREEILPSEKALSYKMRYEATLSSSLMFEKVRNKWHTTLKHINNIRFSEVL